MKKRPRRPDTKSTKKVQGLRSLPAPPPAKSLQYKVVELSTVDEGSLEETVNAYVREGWALDGVQFAMREASKRPAMAFVFFTRTVVGSAAVQIEDLSPSEQGQARERLVRLASTSTRPEAPVSAYERLRQLAEDDPEDDT